MYRFSPLHSEHQSDTESEHDESLKALREEKEHALVAQSEAEKQLQTMQQKAGEREVACAALATSLEKALEEKKQLEAKVDGVIEQRRGL